MSSPDLRGNEEAYAADAVRSTWISSTGPYVDRFEAEFAAACNVRASISVSNGTAALHLAVVALGLGPGDEVIVPSLTYIATANVVRYQGAEPVFVDVDAATWCIDPVLIEAAITPRTRGIIAVHLYGHPADMDAINDIARRHGLWVVEDAAEAYGATYKGRTAGSLATIGTFSFYGNKILTSGEGGALTVDDPEIERRIRLFRGQGMDPNRRYFFPEIGYNYRLTNVAAAILCAQLEVADAMVDARRAIFQRYDSGLSSIPGVAVQPVAEWAAPAPWLYSVTVDEMLFGMSRDSLAARLESSGIETRPFFVPIHTLPPYRGRQGALSVLPVADSLGKTGLSLPTASHLAPASIDRVIRSVAEARR